MIHNKFQRWCRKEVSKNSLIQCSVNCFNSVGASEIEIITIVDRSNFNQVSYTDDTDKILKVYDEATIRENFYLLQETMH